MQAGGCQSLTSSLDTKKRHRGNNPVPTLESRSNSDVRHSANGSSAGP